MFFSTISPPPPAFVYAHSFVLPFPLLFIVDFQLHFLHSYCCELQNLKNTKLPTTNTICFQQLPCFFLSLNIPLVTFIFSFAWCLLINAWSLKLIRPIITSLCVPCTTTWKHLTSSLWMNNANFIFWLLHIHNLFRIFVLTPLRSPCTPFVDCAHLFAYYKNTFGDYIDFSIDCAHNSDDCVNSPDDRTNIVVDSTNTHNISSLGLCIPNLALLQLLLIYRAKMKIMFTLDLWSVLYLQHFSCVVFVFHILHHLPMC